MSLLRGALHNIFAVGGMRMVSAVLGFLVMTAMARVWGVADLGGFALVFSIFLILQQLPLLGLHVLVARTVAGRGDAPRGMGEPALIACVTAVLLVPVVGFMGHVLYPKQPAIAFWIVALTALPNAVTAVVEAFLTGENRLQLIARATVAESVLRAGSCLGVIYLGGGLTAVALCMLLARLALVGIYARMGACTHLLDPGGVSLAGIRGYLAAVPAFLGIFVLSLGLGRLDMLLIGHLKDETAAGIYLPAYKLFELGMMVPGVLALSLFPLFARAFRERRDGFARMYRDSSRGVFILLAPGALLLAVWAGPLLGLLFGTDFQDGAPALRLLALALVTAGLDQVGAVTMLSGDREDLDLLSLSVSLPIFLLALLVTVPVYGATGAAMATLGLTGLRTVGRWWLIGRRMGLSGVPRALLRPTAAALVMAGTLWLTGGASRPLSGAAGLCVYFATLFLSGAVSGGDLAAIRTARVVRGSET